MHKIIPGQLYSCYTFAETEYFEVTECTEGGVHFASVNTGTISFVSNTLIDEIFGKTFKLVREPIESLKDYVFKNRESGALFLVVDNFLSGRVTTIKNLKTNVLVHFDNNKNQIYAAHTYIGKMPKTGEKYKRVSGCEDIVKIRSAGGVIVFYQLSDRSHRRMLLEQFLKKFKLKSDEKDYADLRDYQRATMGRILRPFAEARDRVILDFARTPFNKDTRITEWPTPFGPKISELEKGFNGYVRCKADSVYTFTDLEDRMRNRAISLFPQVGDVYKSKFHGIEATVLKVGKKKFTVSDGHKTWKMGIFAFAGQWIYVRSEK